MSRNKRLICCFTLMLISSLFLLGQKQQQSETYKILGINVEGQHSGDPSAIVANTGLKVGNEITIPSEQTKVAIQRLYNLRLFEDVKIFIENRVPEGVYLLIKVKENPRLERIDVSGNDELDEDDIIKKIDLVKGQIITPQDLSTVIRLLKHQYDEDGYLNAKVIPKLTLADDTTNRVILKVEIDEGPKVKVDYINFHGNKRYDDSDLRGEMNETSQRTWWKFWQSNKFDRKKYKEDKDLIVAFYRKNGFRDVEVLSDSLSYDKSKRYLTIDIYMSEGQQFLYGIFLGRETRYTHPVCLVIDWALNLVIFLTRRNSNRIYGVMKKNRM